MNDPSPRYRLRSSTRFRTVLDEGLALDQETARLHVLNPAAAVILEALTTGPRSVSELVERVLEAFEAEPASVRRDVEAFLGEAIAEGLVEAIQER